MQFFDEIRCRSRQIIGPFLGIGVLLYFAYHIVHGDRGIVAWLTIKQEISQAEAILANTTAERQALEKRVRLLRPESLDPDMLEERARRVLNMGRDGDLVILESDT